jgi:hypothetical protein
MFLTRPLRKRGSPSPHANLIKLLGNVFLSKVWFFAAALYCIFMAFVVGSSVGQFLGDVGFDRLGSYTPALIGHTVALLTAAVLVNRLGPYAYLPHRRISPELRPPRVSAEIPPSRRRVLPICER